MLNLYDKATESAGSIKPKANSDAKIAVILGSGLGELTNTMEDKNSIPYGEIPHAGFKQ